MNKKKGIIIGIFALVITMVIGYALFRKNIEIKGTATASGNFDIGYNCEIDPNASTATGSCEVKDSTIKTKSSLTKPTDEAVFNITITNNGTIPVVLATADSSNNYDVDRLNYGELVAGDSSYLDTDTFLAAYYELTPSGLDNAIYGDSAVETAKITLLPGESLLVWVQHIWVDSALLNMEQPKLPEGGATMEYNVTLGFEQTNN